MSYQNNQQNPPPGYGQQTSTMAIISLISGIASFFVIPLLGAIAAIITGNMAKKEIHQSAGRITGLGMAKWGVILGWINIGFSVVGVCIVLLSVMGVISLASVPFCMMPFTNMNY